MNPAATRKKRKPAKNNVVTIGGVKVTIRFHPGKPTLPMNEVGRVFRKLAAQGQITPSKLPERA